MPVLLRQKVQEINVWFSAILSHVIKIFFPANLRRCWSLRVNLQICCGQHDETVVASKALHDRHHANAATEALSLAVSGLVLLELSLWTGNHKNLLASRHSRPLKEDQATHWRVG
jgi:hypothetical protein